MNKQKMLSKIIALASKKHSEQFDRGGAPYILHCFQVMKNLKSKDQELCCIAIGHDLLEDTDVTPEMLRSIGCSTRVVNGIIAMTRVEGQSYEDYQKQIMAKDDAILVKMADLQHNTDIRRLKGVRDKDIQRTEKYFHFYLLLQKIKLERGL
jgi:(p)ppGpp synthase/HD superfamily hydrolase